MITSNYQPTLKIYKRTVVASTGVGMDNKWNFEIQYYDYPDAAGFYQVCLISKQAKKLFNYFKDNNKNIIFYLKQLIIKQAPKFNPLFTFVKISSVEFGTSQIMLTANFDLLK
jgi:hypothetical protein